MGFELTIVREFESQRGFCLAASSMCPTLFVDYVGAIPHLRLADVFKVLSGQRPLLSGDSDGAVETPPLSRLARVPSWGYLHFIDSVNSAPDASGRRGGGCGAGLSSHVPCHPLVGGFFPNLIYLAHPVWRQFIGTVVERWAER